MTGGDLLSILRHDLAELLATEEVPHAAACAVTEKLIERLQQRCGGDRLLVPKIDRCKRDAEIMADWREGRQPDEIARRRSVDRATVYRVIGRRHQRKVSTGGGGGFGSEDWNL